MSESQRVLRAPCARAWTRLLLGALASGALLSCRNAVPTSHRERPREATAEAVKGPEGVLSPVPGVTPTGTPAVGAPNGGAPGLEGSNGVLPPAKPLPAKVELRGVWLTNVGSEVVYDPKLLREAFASLSAWGLNAAYVVVWNKGYTLYPSDVAARFSGHKVEPGRKVYESWDMLAECVKLGREFGISVIPWFEWGLKVPEGHPALAKHPGWFTVNKESKLFTGEAPRFAYLNPTLDEVRGFFADLATEVVARYGVAGVQFDDHFSLQKDFGYDPTTKRVFKERHGRDAPANPSDAAWRSFRASMVTDMLHFVFQAMRKAKPDALRSVAPIGYPFSYNEHLVDWPRWVNEGMVDELIVQVYREDVPAFTRELGSQPLANAKGRIRSVGVGVWAGFPEKRIDVDFILEKTKVVRQRGFGTAYFYYEALKTWMPAHETPAERATKLGAEFSVPARSH